MKTDRIYHIVRQIQEKIRERPELRYASIIEVYLHPKALFGYNVIVHPPPEYENQTETTRKLKLSIIKELRDKGVLDGFYVGLGLNDEIEIHYL